MNFFYNGDGLLFTSCPGRVVSLESLLRRQNRLKGYRTLSNETESSTSEITDNLPPYNFRTGVVFNFLK